MNLEIETFLETFKHCDKRDGSHDYDLPEFSSHASVGISVLVVIIVIQITIFKSSFSLMVCPVWVCIYSVSINQLPSSS